MPSKPKLTTFENLLQYHINLYYLMRGKNPGIIHDEKKHLHKIEGLDEDYRKDLAKRFPDHDTEENRSRYKQDIDFLTKVFTRQMEAQEKKSSLQALKDKLKR